MDYNLDMSMFDIEPEMDANTVKHTPQKSSNLEVQQRETLKGKPVMEDYQDTHDISDQPLPYIPSTKPTKRGLVESLPHNLKPKPTAQDYLNRPPERLDINDPQFAHEARQRSFGVTDLMDTINRMGEGGVKITETGKEVDPNSVSKLEVVKDNISNTIENLLDPEKWLPAGKEHTASNFKKAAVPIINALRTYLKYLEKIE